ncbi:hypothetical protein Pan216_49050 [Planctomycetes bacterium Pan216]|uniref:ACT domain-containing protein n=1 Tax=Kolteria novifilia TaxID=2527975 RepID=A0A518BAL1_9BACT|nr:hypothetical protein Pan216_49050 [Planctomycetes bacterium Pan216]
MGGSIGEGTTNELRTGRDRDYPSIRQFSIFSPNKVGALQNLVRLIETHRLRVCALSVSDSAECAIIRLVVTHPERAFELLEQDGYAFTEVDLLVVELPNRPQPTLAICSTLLQAEINIQYCFPMTVRPYGRPALAFKVDDHEQASNVLDSNGFIVLTENDLEA